jgi:hypothetical protein
VAERPVLAPDLDEADENVLRPHAHRLVEVCRHLPVQGALLLEAAAAAQRDLDDDQTVATASPIAARWARLLPLMSEMRTSGMAYSWQTASTLLPSGSTRKAAN